MDAARRDRPATIRLRVRPPTAPTCPAVGSSFSASPALRRHIDERYKSDLDGLLTARDAVEALAVSPGWSVLVALLDAEVDVLDAKLDSGLLENRATYAHLHGRRGGLRAAPAFIQALIQRADERLAEQRRKHEGAAEPALTGR